MNPKTNVRVGNLVDCLDVAIKQEVQLNQSIAACLTALTSNVGATIDSIRNDCLQL